MARTKHRHRITDVDEVERTGTCAVCGPGVPLYRIDNRTAGVISWRCRRSAGTTSVSVRSDGTHRMRVAPDDRVALLNAAGGRCGICDRKLTERTMRADHKHGTPDFRGALCARCNQGLGHFGDGDLDLLRKVFAYVERYEEQGCALRAARDAAFAGEGNDPLSAV